MPLVILFFVLAHVNTSYGFSFIKPQPNNLNPSNNLSGKYIKASEFVKLSVQEFSTLTGKKLNLFQRLSFKIAKMRMKHDLKKNPDLKITDYLDKKQAGRSFDIGWFLLGLAGPVIGILTGSLIVFILLAIAPVVIAYATKQNKVSIKSVWVGFGFSIIIILILALIVIAAFGGLIP